MKDISYALGLSMAQNFLNSGIDNLDIESFKNGVSDIFGKKQPSMSLDNARDLINSYFAKIQQEAGEKDKKAGAEFLKANKEKKDVIETESGLQYEIITAGTGAKPKATNTVRCHYEGTLINGTVFDSSYRRNQPADFPVNQVIPGWVEALQLMPVGSKWRLYVPSNLAYGEYGAGDQIGPNATLIFDVELLKIL